MIISEANQYETKIIDRIFKMAGLSAYRDQHFKVTKNFKKRMVLLIATFITAIPYLDLPVFIWVYGI